jgi:hypothetical protein
MALKLAGEECGVVQGLDSLGWLRTVRASDSDPGLSVRQEGTGRVAEFKDGATEVLYIPGGGDVTLGRDLEFQNNLALFNSLLGLGVPSGLFDADYLALRHQTSANKTGLGIYPNASPSDFGGLLEMGMTDRVNDSTNYATLAIQASRSVQKYIIESQAAGSVSLYPIEIRMGGSTLLIFGTDNTIDFNSRSLKNMVAGTDMSLGAYSLKTTNLLLAEMDSNRWHVRNLADTDWVGFYAKNYQWRTTLAAAVSGASLDTLDSDDATLFIRARDNGVGLVEVARLQGAADPTFDLKSGRLTGALDCNGQLLKDPKNYADATLSGTPIIVAIDIGGSEYYTKFYPTKT